MTKSNNRYNMRWAFNNFEAPAGCSDALLVAFVEAGRGLIEAQKWLEDGRVVSAAMEMQRAETAAAIAYHIADAQADERYSDALRVWEFARECQVIINKERRALRAALS